MKRLFFCLSLILTIVGLSCEDKPPESIDYLEEAWSEFEAGNYEDARTNFNTALDSSYSPADGYNGLGWCYLMEGDLTGALSDFETSIAYSSLIDAYAGASLSATDDGEYQKAIDYAEIVIGADDAYEFTHYSAVTIEDIRLVKARSSARLGDYASALAEVRWFLPDFQADPGSPEGQAEILAQIELLLEQYG